MKTNRYIVSFTTLDELYNAGSKAPMDVVRFLTDSGWKLLNIPYMNPSSFKRKLNLPGLVWKYMFMTPKDSELLFVFPYFMWQPTVVKLIRKCTPWFRRRGIRTIGYVIDLNEIRFKEGDLELEMAVLRCFDKLIVHSPQMSQIVRENGYEGEISILGLLDYAVETPNAKVRKLSHDICFAGNLGKSRFLHVIDYSKFPRSGFFFYGNGFTDDITKDNTEYKGRFSPEDLSDIEGSWGLVWDGDSGKALDGFLGRYMKINSPHKASMYVCAGMPLIVPEGSFVAEVVRDKGIGIVLSQLDDLEAAIDTVSEDQYSVMIENVNAFAERLMHGRQTMDAMNS